MRRRGIALAAAGVALATAAAGYGGVKTVARRGRRRPDPAAGDPTGVPDDAVHHTFPSHDGGEIHVVERGSGRPLVLLHGITLTADTWSYQLHDLADRYRVVAVDHRGHGRSRAGELGYGLDLLAHDLATVLAALDVRDAIVVGHSMGGMVLMRFCADHPGVLRDRVAGLVFLSTNAGMRHLAGRLVREATGGGERPTARVPQWLVPGYRFPPNDVSYAMCRLAFGRDASPTHVELTRRMLAAMERDSIYHSGLGLALHDSTGVLEAVALPALVIVGSHDLLTPPRDARRIARRLGDAELVVLPGAGHMIMFERRAELAAVLDRFAGRLPAPGAGTGGRHHDGETHGEHRAPV